MAEVTTQRTVIRRKLILHVDSSLIAWAEVSVHMTWFQNCYRSSNWSDERRLATPILIG